jgi:hypothetical protein
MATSEPIYFRVSKVSLAYYKILTADRVKKNEAKIAACGVSESEATSCADLFIENLRLKRWIRRQQIIYN